MLKHLPHKGIKFLQILFNGILRLTYWPLQLKFAHIIFTPKPGKPPNELTSYRPISLLPTVSKVLEKLIAKRINENQLQDTWLPNHQFGFRHQHFTVQQCHRLTNIIGTALENKAYCTAAFLDIKQAFDKVWHRGLLHKIKLSFPPQYYLLFNSYLSDRYFKTKIGNSTSQIKTIKVGVPQGSILGPILYLLYTSDIPTTELTDVSTFADDTAILSSAPDPNTASTRLQAHLNLLDMWLRKWRIRVNEEKSTHITFTLNHTSCPPVTINHIPMPQTS